MNGNQPSPMAGPMSAPPLTSGSSFTAQSASPEPAPSGPPLPFFPPQEPEEEDEAYKLATDQLWELRQAEIDAMNKLFGFWANPPRQRYAIYMSHEDPTLKTLSPLEASMLGSAGLPLLPWLVAMQQKVPEEAAKMAQDYVTLRKDYGAG